MNNYEKNIPIDCECKKCGVTFKIPSDFIDQDVICQNCQSQIKITEDTHNQLKGELKKKD